MQSFDAEAYGPIFAPLLKTDRARPLGPGSPDRGAREALRSLSVADAFAHAELVDQEMGELCLAGVWLVHDFLDESHTISQNIGSTSGSYWHGIMHRREPDYSNSKYWFRRVGEHPIFTPLRAAAVQLAGQTPHDAAAGFLASQTDWDPFRFVDLCQGAARGQSTSEPLCRQIAAREWELLFDHCYRAATGG